jgi:hypothetical protein
MELTDEELTAQALAADPDAALPADAVSLWDLQAPTDSLLPDWYMPAVVVGPSTRTPRRRRIAVGLITTFVLINAAGLCSTYGHVVIA